MSTIPLLKVVSFSAEHQANKVKNLIKGTGRWTNPVRNVSSAAKGKEVNEMEAEFKMPLCRIEALDLGNCWSSTIEIEVGRSGESTSSRVPLLKSAVINLMTRLDCRNGTNAEIMKFFSKDDINPRVLESLRGWDRLVVICKQPHTNDVLFGLAALSIRGQRLDKEIVFELKETDNIVKKTTAKAAPRDIKARPEWLNPGSRATKLVEEAQKKKKANEKPKREKENRPHFVSPQRKKMRQEDDLISMQPSSSRKAASASRNDIVVADTSSKPKEESSQKKFTFKTSSPSLESRKPENVEIWRKEDFLKYDERSLKASGILVQKRTYKKAKSLPLENGQELRVEAGQEIQFFKQGKLVLMATRSKIYDPLVEPEHVRGIFKDYTDEEVMLSDFQDCNLKLGKKEKGMLQERKEDEKKCPLCDKVFLSEQRLLQHAANCDGLEELSEEVCPVCERRYPPEMLPQHAQECAQQMFD